MSHITNFDLFVSLEKKVSHMMLKNYVFNFHRLINLVKMTQVKIEGTRLDFAFRVILRLFIDRKILGK